MAHPPSVDRKAGVALLEGHLRRCKVLERRIDDGEDSFEALNAWLDARVWSRGSLLTTDALIESATGHALGADAFLRHVRRRYLS